MNILSKLCDELTSLGVEEDIIQQALLNACFKCVQTIEELLTAKDLQLEASQ